MHFAAFSGISQHYSLDKLWWFFLPYFKQTLVSLKNIVNCLICLIQCGDVLFITPQWTLYFNSCTIFTNPTTWFELTLESQQNQCVCNELSSSPISPIPTNSCVAFLHFCLVFLNFFPYFIFLFVTLPTFLHFFPLSPIIPCLPSTCILSEFSFCSSLLPTICSFISKQWLTQERK